MLDFDALRIKLEKSVDEEVIPTLMEYIRVPSLSPLYDPNWESNGLMEKAQGILLSYVRNLGIKNFTTDILKEEGKPWMFYGEVQASSPGLGTILIYGHMDKQPHFPNWIPGTNNTEPALIDGKLYGRGGADDGYALPSAALIIKTLQDMGVPHGRIVIIGETEEESGSPNLVYLISKLKERIGDPDLIICLDSGAGDYEHLWLINSLRGLITAELTVRIIKNGMHSGECSGIVPSTFRIIRQLLDRIEDSKTGELLIPELYTDITPENYVRVASVARVLGNSLISKVEWEDGAQPVTKDIVQALINRTLKPTLCITGADGFPSVQLAGNTLRPYTSLKLSIRLPPSVDSNKAFDKVKEVLTANPPYNATVEVKKLGAGNGFLPKPLDAWIEDALNTASNKFFGADVQYNGEGFSIPFMGMLGEMFPNARFVITGLLGPNSNAHSANEFLHIPFMKKLLGCIGVLIARHAQTI